MPGLLAPRPAQGSSPAASSAPAVALAALRCLGIGITVGALLTGCSRGASAARLVDDAVGGTRVLVRDAETLPSGALRPRAPDLSEVLIPKQTAPTLDDLVKQSAEDLLTPYASQADDEDDFLAIVRGACIANDIVEAGNANTWEAAAENALISFGGEATLRFRAATLGSDLQATKRSGDLAAKIAVFTICEAV